MLSSIRKIPPYRRRYAHNPVSYIDTTPQPAPLVPLIDYNTLKLLNGSDISNFIYHYNACICPYKEGFRLFFRTGNEPKMDKDRIATVLLTKTFEVVPNSHKVISVHTDSSYIHPHTIAQYQPHGSHKYSNGEHSEDPRAVEHNGFWFLTYTDGYKMGVAKLDLDTCDTLYSHYLERPVGIPAFGDGREKNWIPFVDEENRLCMLYGDSPRTIFQYEDSGISLCIREIEQNTLFPVKVTCSFGSVRGGCPPVQYDDEHYIWFFHTYFNHVYIIGAYITKGFRKVVKVLDEPILMGHPQPKFKTTLTIKDNVVYPCGAVKTETGWVISMGVNDYKIGLLHVNRNTLADITL